MKPVRPRAYLEALCVLITLPTLMIGSTNSGNTSASLTLRHQRDKLTLEQRAAYQRSIEEIYWQHRIWPEENPAPKPPLEEVMPPAQIQAKVEDYLRKSKALETYWHRSITGEQLQAEMARMARQTRQPDVLRELFAALGNDPYVIAECLARPALAEKLARSSYLSGERLRSDVKHQAEADLLARKHSLFGPQQRLIPEAGEAEETTAYQYKPVEIPSAAMACTDDTWKSTNVADAPFGPVYHSAIWTGSEMLVWGGLLLDGGKYNPSTDTWSSISTINAPSFRILHTAIWTGSEMIVWGGNDGVKFDTGGKYDPGRNTWTATSTTNAPPGRDSHTAVWTGTEMIIWGGIAGSPISPHHSNIGGKYNPGTDTWTAISTKKAPPGPDSHTAVWTGSEMIVWGGIDDLARSMGGRYNPSTNTWISISPVNAPSPIAHHTAVWTGSEMIIWGGLLGPPANTGARYNPSTDTWTATSITNAPSARWNHTSVWTGKEMVVWGGLSTPSNYFSSGGKYNPGTNTWVAISTNGAVPSARYNHTAVWTGKEMIVFGGFDAAGPTSTGGTYLAKAYTLSPTSQAIPSGGGQSAVNVFAASQCSWTALSSVFWVTILSGSVGIGNGTIVYSVDANVSPSPRTGTMTIASQTFTVTQNGNLPVPSITSATVSGKKLIVNGQNFDSGAELLLNTEQQNKVSNDPDNPTSRLIAKKSGKKIQVGDKLQVRNPNGTVSDEFTFTGQ